MLFRSFSSSDPPRPFLGGGTGRRELDELDEDEEDVPETDDGVREIGAFAGTSTVMFTLGSTADLPFGELWRSPSSWRRLTQLLSRRSSSPERRSESFRSRTGTSSARFSCSLSWSCSMTTTGRPSACDTVESSSLARGDCTNCCPGGEVRMVEGGKAPSRLCTLLEVTSLTDVL